MDYYQSLLHFLNANGLALLIFLAIALVGFCAWSFFSPRSRRNRTFRNAEKLLGKGDWPSALELIRPLLHLPGLPSRQEDHLRSLHGRCELAAGKQQLQDGEYEKGLDILNRAMKQLQKPETEARRMVVEAMVKEIRARFAKIQSLDPARVLDIVTRTLIIDSENKEVLFWQAMCFLRQGKADLAIGELEKLQATSSSEERMLEPPLYLGALLLRQKKAKEALRFLTEANRLDSKCPVVTTQLGAAMIEAGGDAQIAIRALQRVLGEKGFLQWQQKPDMMWVEGFPEKKSYIRKISEQFSFHCPLWGSGYDTLEREARAALGLGYYRTGQYERAHECFEKLAQASAPSSQVLRGLGLSLARLGKYDQAFKHLRTAHELEHPKDPITAGFMALCAAKGTPAQPEDKANNLHWAQKVVLAFEAPGNEEWVEILKEIYAEVQAFGVPSTVEDLGHLCRHLASIRATDIVATKAYHEFALAVGENLPEEYAWLYCRGSRLADHIGQKTLTLFHRTLADRPKAEEYLSQLGCSWEDLEYSYLEKSSRIDPGHFPPGTTDDYPAQAGEFLLSRLKREEEAGQLEAAIATGEIFSRLAPNHGLVKDSLARLHDRLGQRELAIEVLQQWHQQAPEEIIPLVRLAVLYHQTRRSEEALDLLINAQGRVNEKERGKVALLGAQILLQKLWEEKNCSACWSSEVEAKDWDRLDQFLEIAQANEQVQSSARWFHLAVGIMQEKRELLQKRMEHPEFTGAEDPRDQLLSAIASQLCGRLEESDRLCRLLRENPNFQEEAAYVLGWSYLENGQAEQALKLFAEVSEMDRSPSREHALALLGALKFKMEKYSDCADCWIQISPDKRQHWHLDEVLGQVVFLSALQLLADGKYNKSADQLREAGRLGVRHPLLGQLLSLSLFKAGQRLLFTKNNQETNSSASS